MSRGRTAARPRGSSAVGDDDGEVSKGATSGVALCEDDVPEHGEKTSRPAIPKIVAATRSIVRVLGVGAAESAGGTVSWSVTTVRVYSSPLEPMPPTEWIEVPLEVEPNLDGYRLDRFLKAKVVRLSRARIQAIIERGQVLTLEGLALMRPAIRVRLGQRFILLRPAPHEPDAVMEYRVVHTDRSLLVIDKPAGLAVHPSARYHRNTLTALMRERMGPEHGWEMAHRLDRETSGLMLFGRRRLGPGRAGLASGGILKRSFQQREIWKSYLAIVRGSIDGPVCVDLPLGRALESEIQVKMEVRSPERGGLPAATDVAPLQHFQRGGEALTLVACAPRTGRQHQIRVHLAALGTPVLGDKLYGVEERAFLDVMENGRPVTELETQAGFWRQALHAWRVSLPHPDHGERLEFEAPWPVELADLIPFTP